MQRHWKLLLQPSNNQSSLFFFSLMSYLLPAISLVNFDQQSKISQKTKRPNNWLSQFLTKKFRALDRQTDRQRQRQKTILFPWCNYRQKQKEAMHPKQWAVIVAVEFGYVFREWQLESQVTTVTIQCWAHTENVERSLCSDHVSNTLLSVTMHVLHKLPQRALP